MDDSGAILCQISAYKDKLDEVNEEIEQNIQKTREIESEIVKCAEVEKDLVNKESELLKMLSIGDFELNGLVQIAATARNSLEALECDLRFLKTNMDEILKRISQKSQFQVKTLSSTEELTSLLSEKEALENEKETLNMKINALQNSTKECLEEILEEIQISNSALDADIEHGTSENRELLNDIEELKILLSENLLKDTMLDCWHVPDGRGGWKYENFCVNFDQRDRERFLSRTNTLMSTSQDMVPVNEESNTISPENQPVKRKRGRPRKSESSGVEQLNKIQSVMTNPASSSADALVGQPVSGYLDGSFDSGYLLTVRVGESGPVFKGMVFVPGQSVPVTAENDIAPHLPMQKRVDVATQMAGEQNQPAAAAAAPIHCRPSNAQTTDSTSLSAPVIHVPEDLSNKVPITIVQASEGISNYMNPCTQNMGDALQLNLLKRGNMETTIAEINVEPSSQVAVEPNQSEKNLQSMIPQVPSGAYEEPLSVTTLGSEAQVGEAVQAPSGIEVGMVEGATGALGSGTSDSNVIGKETEGEVQDSLGLGAQLQINALPEDRLEELKDGMDQPTNTEPPTSEAMTSQVEFEIKEACNNPEVGKNNQSSSDAPQTD